jgi:hypothetical protein
MELVGSVCGGLIIYEGGCFAGVSNVARDE